MASADLSSSSRLDGDDDDAFLTLDRVSLATYKVMGFSMDRYGDSRLGWAVSDWLLARALAESDVVR